MADLLCHSSLRLPADDNFNARVHPHSKAIGLEGYYHTLHGLQSFCGPWWY